MLFIDPAYDAQLGSAPAAHRERLARPLLKDGVLPDVVLPANLGELVGSRYADRARANLRGSVVFMADLAFEKPMSPAEQRIADAGKDQKKADGGDLFDAPSMGKLVLTFAVTTSQGERRDLYFGIPTPTPLPAEAWLTEPNILSMCGGIPPEALVLETLPPRLKVTRPAKNEAADQQLL